MSWTSEFEPSPPRPNLDPDDLTGDGFEVVGVDEVAEATASDTSPSGDPSPDIDSDESPPFPDEGPLDPSIFDGLFDDLGEGDDDVEDEQDPAPQRPLPSEPGPTDGHEQDAEDGPLDRHEQDAEDDPLDRHEQDPDRGQRDGDDDWDGDGIGVTDGPPDPPRVATADGDPDRNHDGSFGSVNVTSDRQAKPWLVDEMYAADKAAADTSTANPNTAAADTSTATPNTAAGADSAGPAEAAQVAIVDEVPNGVTLDPEETPFNAGVIPARPEDETPTDLETIFVDASEPESVTPTAGTGLFEPAAYPAVEPGLADHRPPGPAAGQYHRSGFNGEAGGIGTGYRPTDLAVRQLDTKTPSVVYQTPRRRRRWPAFAVATVVGAVLGIGGALLLFELVQFSDSEAAETATPVTTVSPAAPDVAASADPPEETPDDDPTPDVEESAPSTRASLFNLAATGRFELNTISFVPGAVDLTESSRALLDEVAEVMISRPDQPVSISVRTFSESSPTANRDLSQRQAEAIVNHLVAKGAPVDGEDVRGVGAARLDLAQPVQNFVVVNTDLGTSTLSPTIENISPFAIGIDPVTNQLRPESIEPLNVLGIALSENDEAAVSLAGYSYGEPDSTRNRELATVAAEAAAAFLVANHEIERQRVSTLAPGQALYVIGPDAGSHVSLQWGEPAEIANRLAELTSTDIVFAPGSARLVDETLLVLDQLIELIPDTDLTVVIQVHAATETSDDANLNLSSIQAAAISEYLLQSGLSATQVRAYGGGNLRQFEGTGTTNRVVVTAIP